MNHRHADVNQVQHSGGIHHLGAQLANGRAGAFCPHQVHVRTAGHLNHRQQEHQNTHAAQPVGKAAPEQHTVGQGFYITENTGAGGGEAGNGFKERVGEVGNGTAEEEGQTARQAQHDPTERRGNTALFHIKDGVLGLAEGNQMTQQQAAQHHAEERPTGGLLVNQRHNAGQRHKSAL